MEIYHGAIFDMAREGRLSLQVPEFCLGSPTPKTATYPDEYFMRVKVDGPRLSLGKENGFLHFSPIGWKFFKPQILARFSKMRGHTAKELSDYADQFFLDVGKGTRKFISTKLIDGQKKLRLYNLP